MGLMAFTKDIINGRVPLIVGTGMMRTEGSIAYAKEAKAVGADAIMISSPPYAAPIGFENAQQRLGGQSRLGILPADPMGTTVLRISGTGGDRLVIRNRFTCDPSPAISEQKLDKIVRSHDRSFNARFPMLKDVTIAYRWGGRLCLPRNGVPAFGEVEANVFAACCQNGLGTTKGMLSGLFAAELVAKVDNSMITEMQASDVPARFPPEPFAQIGASTFMRWKELRAGPEL